MSFRVVKQDSNVSSEKSTGTVDMLYTFGAPGSASPSFLNPRHSRGCFPGKRAWAGRKYSLKGTADMVPQISWPLGYRHPMMDSMEMDVRAGKEKVREMACSPRAEEEPKGRVYDPLLHAKTWYVNSAHRVSEAFGNLTDIAAVGSYIDDIEHIKRRTEVLGWKYVNMAKHPGNTIRGGSQQVHLVQHPRTLECLITFQGTDSFQDWMANFATGKSHFCGFVDTDESCRKLIGGVCKVKRAGNSFVHKGFRDHLRRMIRSSDFQSKIRPNLSGCSKLTVAGHSLGGAMSEIFTACMARAPRAGQYGYEEDYKYISYTKGKARRMWK